MEPYIEPEMRSKGGAAAHEKTRRVATELIRGIYKPG